ncbi:tyrosine-type recombinase/integrase [Baekduia soli]|uniref:tyrosine-type recombinase/integrase n=1 Tax=Baekduia soli TaxID=496014 RepID=UPI001651E7DF|nr:site-specific integrase [Baekduia soli]
METYRRGRVWVAKYRRADGSSTRKVLGPAWVKDSGRATPRGATVWRAADGTKPEGSLTPKEAQEALRVLLESERAVPVARRPGAADASFGAAAAAWLSYVEVERGIATTTLNRYRSLVGVHLVPAFGDRTPLRAITTERIDAYIGALVRGERTAATGRPLSRDSIRQLFIALNGILRRAQRRGLIAHNPMADAERVAVAKSTGEFHVLQPAQVEAVARAAATDWTPMLAGPRCRTTVTHRHAYALTLQRRWNAQHWAACIRIAAYTGLRLGELRALRWRDVDWAGAVLHVRRNAPASLPASAGDKPPKSGRVGSVPLIPQAARTLEALTRRRLDPDDPAADPMYAGEFDFVFPAIDGRMADIESARHAFYRALALAGLGYLRQQHPPIRFHDLRHTFGTLAVRAFPLSDVQRWMRHADIKTTMRYVHYVPQHDAARRLGEVFATELGPVAEDLAAAPVTSAADPR